MSARLRRFWAWAVSETLRLAGCQIEEVLELTQLSLRHYTPPSTGKLVPLLHIIPSKTDAERLIPMSPELVTVLVAVQRQARGYQPQIPLSVRYDPHEKQHGQPLPHLFVRRVELGDCFRPYGTPCAHEHACIKCPLLRIDPAQMPRLEQIEVSTVSRLAEARERQCLGEVSALQDNLRHIRSRKAQATARS